MKPYRSTWIAALLLLGAAAVAFAQQQSQQQSQQSQQQQQSTQQSLASPAQPLYQTANPVNTTPADQVTEPDNRPISGIEPPTLGASLERLNSLRFGIQYAQMADSNSAIVSGENRIETVSAFGGDIGLTRTGKRGQFSAHYLANGVVFPRHMEFNAAGHTFDMSQLLNFGRWTVSVVDSGEYSPESPWGGAFGGSFDEFTRVSDLNPGLAADQGIFTTRSPRWSNTVAGQLQYQFTPRTSWTGSASYSMLRFTRSGLIDSDQYMIGTGYSWQATAKDSIGFSYNYSQYRPHGGAWYHIHGADARYARRVTGRMSLGLTGGGGLALEGGERRIAWTAGAQMNYTRGGRGFGFFYAHGYGASSGAFYHGVESNQAGISLASNLRWRWGAGATAEMNRYNRLGATDRVTSGYAGVQIFRAIGRYSSVFLSYGFGRQVSDLSVPVTDIPSNMSRHIVAVGFRWSYRPIMLGR